VVSFCLYMRKDINILRVQMILDKRSLKIEKKIDEFL